MAHTNHSSHANHSNHSSHGAHASHSQHSVHANHANTYVPNCVTIGTTFTKLSNPKTTTSFWNDLKAKINQARASWGLSTTDANDVFTPSVDAKVFATQWNTYIRDRLNQAPMNNYGTNAPTATAATTKLSALGYNKGIDYAQSKMCSNVCPSVCLTIHTNHVNHASHGAHSSHSQHSQHGSHSNHTNHTSHSSHNSHSDHSNHNSHADHDNHSSHANHSAHSSHRQHASHSNMIPT